jgi:DNA processing protein
MEKRMPFLENAISPFEEMVAYEALASRESLKEVSRRLSHPGLLPSRLIRQTQIPEAEIASIRNFLEQKSGFTIYLRGLFQYPLGLEDAQDPVRVFYAKGDIGLLESRRVSVVGARKVSPEGARRAAKLTSGLVKGGFTIVSGLAVGVDTVALTTAVRNGGRVVAVIGTPIDEYYPKENRSLQDEIALKHLLISQVPFYRYRTQPFAHRRFYFPMRNETMAALSEATVIVEASETSGTLTQARACIQQGRKLFILDSCFENEAITWPRKFEAKGAVRIRSVEQILSVLGDRKPREWQHGGEE